MSSRLQLLKLSKSKLIALCKKHNLATNGNKNDLVQRLISSASFQEKQMSEVRQQVSDERKQRMRKEPVVPNKRSCACYFEPVSFATDLTHIHLDRLLPIVINEFVPFVPLYTLANFLCAFPEYQQQCTFIARMREKQQSMDFSKFTTHQFTKTKRTRLFSMRGLQSKSKKKMGHQTAFRLMVGQTPNLRAIQYGEELGNVDKLTHAAIVYHRTDVYTLSDLLMLYAFINNYDKNITINQKNIAPVIQWFDALGLSEILRFDEQSEKHGEREQLVLFVYLFLELIFSFDGQTKFTVYTRKSTRTNPRWDHDCREFQFCFEHETESVIYVLQFKVSLYFMHDRTICLIARFMSSNICVLCAQYDKDHLLKHNTFHITLVQSSDEEDEDDNDDDTDEDI